MDLRWKYFLVPCPPSAIKIVLWKHPLDAHCRPSPLLRCYSVGSFQRPRQCFRPEARSSPICQHRLLSLSPRAPTPAQGMGLCLPLCGPSQSGLPGLGVQPAAAGLGGLSPWAGCVSFLTSTPGGLCFSNPSPGWNTQARKARCSVALQGVVTLSAHS